MLNYEIDHNWNASSKTIMEALESFNVDFIGTDASKKLSIIVTDSDGQIVGGLVGETRWNWIYIGWVWVNEKYRTQGIGRKLMLEAEREAVAMHCNYAHLTTLDFQARTFYEKLGYEVFASMENYPQGHTRFLMKKAIT